MNVSPASSRHHVLGCGHCGAPLRLTQYTEDGRMGCPHCGRSQRVVIAPALQQEPADKAAVGELAMGDDATCFYHPTKRASVVCDASGRFLCDLCKVEYNGRHYSMESFERLRREGTASGFVERVKRLDRLALLLAVGPWLTVVFFMLSVVTGPLSAILAGLALARRPASPLKIGRWVATVALILGVAQSVFWGFVVLDQMDLFAVTTDAEIDFEKP